MSEPPPQALLSSLLRGVDGIADGLIEASLPVAAGTAGRADLTRR